MKATGIVRRIDDLGRVVIPKRDTKDTADQGRNATGDFTDREGQIILKNIRPLES